MRSQEIAIILHGIGHTRWNMIWVENALKTAGYKTINITYPSTSRPINALADFIHKRLISEDVWNGPEKVHFVTHSMGGLVTQHYLHNYKSQIPSQNIGRVVMLAPPYNGSEVADLLKNFLPYKWIFGPAGQELVTTRQAILDQPHYELGIITGTAGWPYIFGNITIKGKNDGRVAVERTKISGMKDHLIINATHSFISWRADVHWHIVNFLKNGDF